jgi:hypothetical protein
MMVCFGEEKLIHFCVFTEIKFNVNLIMCLITHRYARQAEVARILQYDRDIQYVAEH